MLTKEDINETLRDPENFNPYDEKWNPKNCFDCGKSYRPKKSFQLLPSVPLYRLIWKDSKQFFDDNIMAYRCAPCFAHWLSLIDLGTKGTKSENNSRQPEIEELK